jgi:hypothetical protein
MSVWAAPAGAAESARIDERTALLDSPAGPLAELGGDHRAVWAAVPAAAERQVMVYFHGNDGFVTASSTHPRGYLPSWAPRGVSAEAVGPAYDLHRIAAEAPSPPVVLAPEVGVRGPQGGGAWAVTSSGAFARDRVAPDALGRLVEDAVVRLGALGLVPSSFRAERVLVAAHSGGGRLLASLLATETVRSRPVDLWMLDATYGWGEPEDYARAVAAWREQGRLEGPGHNRLVMAYIAGTSTGSDARAIVAAAARLGLPARTVRWTDPDRDRLLAALPVVALELPPEVVSHGTVPLEVLPLLLRTVSPP